MENALATIRNRRQAKADRKRQRRLGCVPKTDCFTLTRKEWQRAEQRARRLYHLGYAPEQLPVLPEQENLDEHTTCQYRRWLKQYFTAIECQSQPQLPSQLPANADDYLKKLHAHAVEVYNRRITLAKEAENARTAFATRPLQKPHQPINPRGSGKLRYEAAFTRWKQKMLDRGYVLICQTT